jgi:hypothetical protein
VQCLVVALCLAIIAANLSDPIRQGNDSGLKRLVGGGSSLRLHIWEHPYECELGILVYEFDEMLDGAACGSEVWTTYIRLDKLKIC